MRPSRIHIGRLTRNVTKDHVVEIFSCYGEIKSVEFPNDRLHHYNGRGFCYVEYLNPDDAENAMKHMDGGQIDGQEVTAAPVLNPKPLPMRRSPIRGGVGRGGPPMRNRPWDRRGGRDRRRSPPMRRRSRSPIRRSRSPVRRRRNSNSSDSSR